MFKTLSIFMHACSQLLSSLVDGRINNAVLQTLPDFNEALLQLISTANSYDIHTFSAA